ncbi:MAG TPA: hypothetical protein VF897_13970, partial [Roseiflexaceae bacterium]
MNADDLAKQIQTMRRRLNVLYRAAGDPQPQETLAQAFEELQAAHEELMATEEELRRKNEEMLDMR